MSGNVERSRTPEWPWPDSLDALSAATEYHRLLFENEPVRVLALRLKPCQFVAAHTHRWPSTAYVVSGSDFIRRDGEGKVLFDSRTAEPAPATPVAQWIPSLPPHSVENVASAEIFVISTELKEPR